MSYCTQFTDLEILDYRIDALKDGQCFQIMFSQSVNFFDLLHWLGLQRHIFLVLKRLKNAERHMTVLTDCELGHIKLYSASIYCFCLNITWNCLYGIEDWLNLLHSGNQCSLKSFSISQNPKSYFQADAINIQLSLQLAILYSAILLKRSPPEHMQNFPNNSLDLGWKIAASLLHHLIHFLNWRAQYNNCVKGLINIIGIRKAQESTNIILVSREIFIYLGDFPHSPSSITQGDWSITLCVLGQLQLIWWMGCWSPEI